MEGKGKQDSTANVTNVNKNCADIGVIPKQEVLVDDQLSGADEELIIHYLDKKMMDQPFPNYTVHEVDVFLYHPQKLSQMHHPSQAKKWYFLSPASNKYTEGGQSNGVSANNDGYWEPCGTDSLIHKDGKLIGYRKTLNYIAGKLDKDRKRTEWLMHEYRLEGSRDVPTSDDMQRVFCKLFKSNNKLMAAEEKEATKFAAPNDGVSGADPTIQGPENANDITNDKGPSNGHSRDLLPMPETDQDTTMPTPTPQHVQGTTLTRTGRQKATNNVVRNKRPRRKRDSHPPPASHQGLMMPHLPNANSQPQRDQGIRLPPPLPQNDERKTLPISTGPYKANNGVVVTDNGPSNSLVVPCCPEYILDEPSFDWTVANSWLQDGTVLPSRPQHGQQTILPSLTGNNTNADEVSVIGLTLNHLRDAQDLPSSVQLPKLPSVQASPRGSHENEAAVAPRYDGWPLHTAETRLPPFDGPFESLTEEELAFFDKPDPGYPEAFENKKEAKK
ncbi:uncharacterized protein [Nicotiana tomentosiformis]|uniref:uncharacterized protein isoform X1 n=1 Tax=Nicotiana tomentosiformis TaxID=4098 RepID=UPI00051B9D2D|nr:uncharacterized protein LOC104101418 isoform X1 [Nicotiana tomentosiformis]XP_009607150.1 uncharacterized protein LOC104101418 isoform X1 [Nicotiana tomentosiformis]